MSQRIMLLTNRGNRNLETTTFKVGDTVFFQAKMPPSDGEVNVTRVKLYADELELKVVQFLLEGFTILDTEEGQWTIERIRPDPVQASIDEEELPPEFQLEYQLLARWGKRLPPLIFKWDNDRDEMLGA